jgi:hypothetical protein
MSNVFAMATANRITDVLTRNGHTRGAQRTTEKAESLSQKNVYAARSKLMQTALVRCARLCYETFPGSHILCNVDLSNRLLIPVPWSSNRYTAFNLRRTEADALRWEMMARCDPDNAEQPLFVWMSDFRAWYLNLRAYPTEADARLYLQSNPITWRTLAGYMRLK